MLVGYYNRLIGCLMMLKCYQKTVGCHIRRKVFAVTES